jgi:hypothetical protein
MDLTDVYTTSVQYTFFSAAMELSPKLIIFYSKKQASANIRKQK